MFGIDLHDYLNGVSWEQGRGYIRDELDALKAELQGRWNVALGTDNQITNLSIKGNGTVATRYVANTGPNNAPKWDLINLVNGVKNRLLLRNFAAATPGTVLGLGSTTAAGDYVALTIGDDLQALTDTLNVSDRVAAATSQQLWTSEGGI